MTKPQAVVALLDLVEDPDLGRYVTHPRLEHSADLAPRGYRVLRTECPHVLLCIENS